MEAQRAVSGFLGKCMTARPLALRSFPGTFYSLWGSPWGFILLPHPQQHRWGSRGAAPGRVQGCSPVPGVPATSWSPFCHGTGRSWCLGMLQGAGMLRMHRWELLALPGGALLLGGAQRCPRKDTENFPHRGKRNPWQLLQPPQLPAARSKQLPLPARGFTAPCSPEGLFIGGFIFAFSHPYVFLPAQSCYSRPLISRQRSPPPNPAARVQLPDVETSSQPRGN